MKKIYTLSILFPLLAVCMMTHAQTCSNEVVQFRETFGSGNGNAALPVGRTNYQYNGASPLADGDYTLNKSSQAKPEWHNGPDHTGDVNGRMMVTNASFTPGEFYRDTVYSLSSLTTYSVYLYAMNVNTVGTCSPNPILPRLQLVVESYNIDGSFTELSSMVSNSLPQMSTPTWVLISGFINVPAGVTAVRYRIINNSTGGCGNDVAIDDITFSQCGQIMLPVTGLSLKAHSDASSVNLSWSTLQEINTDKFIIEKSNDGKTWKAMNWIKAAGQSASAKNYSLVDHTPYSAASYYRIAAIDMDGRITYSNNAVIKAAASAALQLTAFPNPFISSVGVEVTLKENKPGASLRLFDIRGKLIRNIPWNLKSGTNVMTVNSLDKLGSGLYFLDIADANGQIISRTKLLK